MATRPEFVEMCIELDIDWQDLTTEEMKQAVRRTADRRFKSKKFRFSASKLSETLRRFLTLEHDFVIFDREGNQLDYKGNIMKRGVK